MKATILAEIIPRRPVRVVAGDDDGGGLGGTEDVLSIVSHELAGPEVPHVNFA